MSKQTNGAKCLECGAPFTVAKPWAKFCSSRCRVKAHRALKVSEDPAAVLARELIVAVRKLQAGYERDGSRRVRAALRSFDAEVSR